MAQASAIFGGSDFARDAGVIERGHVDEIAAGKSDVAGDARAFFAERLLGDLDDDFLALLQHVSDELRCGAVACGGHGYGLPLARAADGGRGRGVRRDRDGHRGRVRRGARDAACASGNHSGRARSRAAVPAAAIFGRGRIAVSAAIRLRRRHDLKFLRASEASEPACGLRLRHALRVSLVGFGVVRRIRDRRLRIVRLPRVRALRRRRQCLRLRPLLPIRDGREHLRRARAGRRTARAIFLGAQCGRFALRFGNVLGERGGFFFRRSGCASST